MHMPKILACVLMASLAVALPLADVWDVQSDGDNTSGTDNELVHGSEQIHDLGALAGPVADQDWYSIGIKPYSSYEVSIDGVSGDVDPLDFQRLSDATTVVQNSLGDSAIGMARSLRFMNTTAAAVQNFIRVSNPACGTGCGADDTYRIKARETTIRVARFNNAGTQITVLLTQNASEIPITVTMFFWNAAGTLVAPRTITLAPAALDVYNTSATAPSTSGHLTVIHDGAHGTLNVKSVALEPSTGFSFDTPGVYRPY